MRKTMVLLLTCLLMLGLTACNKVTLHCDGCGKEVAADPKMDEGWIIFCEECGEPEIDWGE